MSCRAPVAGLTAQPVYPRVASTVSPAPQLRAMRVAMGRKIPGRRFASFPSVRRLFMVRHMELRGRKGILGIVLLVLVAAGLVGSHMLVSSRKPTVSAAPACPTDHERALACYEQYYGSIVAQQGVPEAFAALKEQYGRDPNVQHLCHALTHVIGQAAARKYSDLPEAFQHGDNFCGSGYYHGVLQGRSFQMGRERLLSDLNSICAGIPGKERKSLEYYNCVHGLGHAVMAITGDDLFDALHDCDGLTGSMEGNACASGVFMENLIVDGAHGGHYSKYLKPSEPLYPCTAVDKKYKPACFDLQTSYALGAVQGDFAKVFSLCAAPCTTCSPPHRGPGSDSTCQEKSRRPPRPATTPSQRHPVLPHPLTTS